MLKSNSALRMLAIGQIALGFTVANPAIAQQNPPSTAGQPPAVTAKTISDQTFVREASAAGLAEVRDARKALQMAKRDEVRQAAQQILTDHEAANARLTALAGQKNLPVATAPAPSPAAKGGDFDSAYVAAQIEAHEKAIALFKGQVQNGRDNDLRAFAAETLPTLEKHLAMMRGLASN
jgi:putative membrane protein